MPSRNFWRPPLWKWIVLLALLAGVIVLARWKPAAPPVKPVKIELLAFADSSPALPIGCDFPGF
jgi:hypothetical protein